MKKNHFLIISLICLGLTACNDGVNLPDIGVETDLTQIPLPEEDESLVEIAAKSESEAMIHCGGLHTSEDFARVLANQDESPWKEQLAILRGSGYAQTDYTANPLEVITRYGNSQGNYKTAERNVTAAYQLGLRYHLGDGDEYAEASVAILKGWATTCTDIDGGTDRALASGLLGYEFAVAGELMRDYWQATDPSGFSTFQQWMANVFYPECAEFIAEHYGTPNFHYWANWFLANIAAEFAIGIVSDRRDIYNEALDEFQTGEHSGRITNAIYHVFDGEYANLAQWQESGRDSGHTFLCQGLVATICQLTWNQGDDFYAYGNNRFLKGCEYNSRYHWAGLDVPYVTFTKEYMSSNIVTTEVYDQIADRTTSAMNPFWAISYYHYGVLKAVDAEAVQYTKYAMSRSFTEVTDDDQYSEFGLFSPAGILMFAPAEE